MHAPARVQTPGSGHRLPGGTPAPKPRSLQAYGLGGKVPFLCSWASQPSKSQAFSFPAANIFWANASFPPLASTELLATENSSCLQGENQGPCRLAFLHARKLVPPRPAPRSREPTWAASPAPGGEGDLRGVRGLEFQLGCWRALQGERVHPPSPPGGSSPSPRLCTAPFNLQCVLLASSLSLEDIAMRTGSLFPQGASPGSERARGGKARPRPARHAHFPTRPCLGSALMTWRVLVHCGTPARLAPCWERRLLGNFQRCRDALWDGVGRTS